MYSPQILTRERREQALGARGPRGGAGPGQQRRVFGAEVAEPLRGLKRTLKLTGPKPEEIKVETFRIDYLIRTQKVEKLSLQPISKGTFQGFLKGRKP